MVYLNKHHSFFTNNEKYPSMEYAARDSSFSQGAEGGLEQEYREYQRRCASYYLATHTNPQVATQGKFTQHEAASSTPDLVSLMLQTAIIHAPYLDVSVGGTRSFVITHLKSFFRWVLRPFVKVSLVHQQEMNHLVVLLAQSHLILEKKVARLEAALEKSAKH
jgi:hypothetical protein